MRVFGKDLSETSFARHERVRNTVRGLYNVVRHSIAEIQKDRAPQVAAALTYHTLFSLLPTIALALVVLKAFVGPEQLTQFHDFIVGIAVDWLAEEPATATAATAGEAEPANTTEFTLTVAKIDETVTQFLNQMQNVNFASIGVVGIFVFIYGATALLSTIEQAFNQIFRAPEGRPIGTRLPLYFTTITIGPIFIVAGQVLQAQIMDQISGISWTAWLATPAAFILPILTTWAVFAALYILIPHTRVHWKAAAIGAAIAAAAWVVVVELFGVYVGNYAGTSLYGALALVPLALSALWIAWLIVLLGLEIVYTLQTQPWRTSAVDSSAKIDVAELYDPRWMVLTFAQTAEDFDAGIPSATDKVAQQLQLPETVVQALFTQLEKAGFVHRIQQPDDDGPPCYSLARPPSRIAINDVLDFAERRTLAEARMEGVAGAGLVSELQNARRAAMKDRFFRSITRRQDSTQPDRAGAA